MKALEPGADFARVRPEPAAARRAGRAAAGRIQAGDTYSRAVGLLKRVLPMIGASLLLLVAAWPRLAPLLQSVRLNISGIDLRAARELKMINPRYAGTDRLNRPFVVTAAVGRQLPERNDLMSLERPRAVMIAHGGERIVLTAATAIYQSQPQLLDLFDNVVVTHQNGTRFVTQRAHADLAHDTADGRVPIEGHGPSGDIWGQGFRVLDKGDTIIFTGRSRAILRGTKPVKPATAPPEPPEKVLNAAAALEIAATAPDDRPPDLPLAATRAKAADGHSPASQDSADGRRHEGTAPPQGNGERHIDNLQAEHATE
jgi:lipopolysaccharide export system protein LptC